MAVYKNISSDTTSSPVTLISKGGTKKGHVKSVTITNHHSSTSNVIELHLWNGLAGGDSLTYVIAATTIPPLATLVLNDNLTFNSELYNLRITTSTTADTTVIVK